MTALAPAPRNTCQRAKLAGRMELIEPDTEVGHTGTDGEKRNAPAWDARPQAPTTLDDPTDPKLYKDTVAQRTPAATASGAARPLETTTGNKRATHVTTRKPREQQRPLVPRAYRTPPKAPPPQETRRESPPIQYTGIWKCFANPEG